MTESTAFPHIRSAGAARDGAVDIGWSSGENDRLWGYWLRVLASDEERFSDVAAAWTDGANFHPQQHFAAAAQHIVEAEVSAQGDTVIARWRDGFSAAIDSVDLYRSLHRDDPVAGVAAVPWGSDTSFRSWSWPDVTAGRDRAALRSLLHEFLAVGVVFVHDVPALESSVVTFANTVGTLDPSHLGDTFTIEVAATPDHIGQVAAEIPLHIDLVYRQSVPDIQILHALRQVSAGGENEFVDACHLVRQLDPDDVEVLASVPVEFVARSGSVHFRGRHPILTLTREGGFASTCYNQYKIRFPHDAPPHFFAAFERFRSLLDESKKTFLLPSDSLVMFDNRRILHGRRRFLDEARKIVGCFVKGDDVRCLFRALEVSR